MESQKVDNLNSAAKKLFEGLADLLSELFKEENIQKHGKRRNRKNKKINESSEDTPETNSGI